MLKKSIQWWRYLRRRTPSPNHFRREGSAQIIAPASPTRTFRQFFEHVKKLGFDAQTIIDVGAADGTPPLHEAFPNAYFYLFEPLPEFISDLESLMSDYRGEVHNCALMDEAGSSTIFRHPDLVGSSMMHKFAGTNNPRLQEVTVRTLDGVLEGKELAGPVLLKTDCQAGDFAVVKGGATVLRSCEIVIMEISFFQFRGEHHPDALEIFNFMNERGFVIYDFLDGIFRPFDGALGQIDVVFVKKDSPLKANHRWVALK